MLTTTQKNEILLLVNDEKERLGSYRAVAQKCKISEATISQLRKGTYAADGDDIYHTIGVALGYKFDTKNWQLAETHNFIEITQLLESAKERSLFIGIAHRAGCGKTAASDAFLANNRKKGVFKINCREWHGKAFLTEIIREIGAEVPRGYCSQSDMIDSVSEAFKGMSHTKPLLILDQANSLKPSAFRTLIHIYNELENVLAVAMLGTDNLEHEIKRGVRLNKLGYDEIASRIGTKLIHLTGTTLADTRRICAANGITDQAVQSEIFGDCSPVRVASTADGQSRTITVIEDLRRLKRLIISKQLLMSYETAN